MREQRDLARLSSRGQHIGAERSGHWSQFDQPELVVIVTPRLSEASLHAARSGTIIPTYDRGATRFGTMLTAEVQNSRN